MAETNGTPVIIPEEAEREPYRPPASTEQVYERIASSLSDVVRTSARQGANFVSLFDIYDRDETLAVRYGHLVDAAECLEIALTHLGLLKASVGHQLRIADEQNGPIPF
jgi:hypothetical protein